MIEWKRNAAGVYEGPSGFTIRKVTPKSRQHQPFARVPHEHRATAYWAVEQNGHPRASSATLAGAKKNAERAIEIQMERSR